MSPNFRSFLPYIIIAGLCVPLFFINVHSVHNWGDDFAQYIKQAMNIASGHPYYESNYIFNPNHTYYGPPQYPPGFSLLLAPVVAIWGLSIKHMLYLISLCLIALFFTLFAFYRKYTNDITALCLAALSVYARSVIEFKDQVLSDIPCWLFVVLYFMLRKSSHFSNTRILLLVLTATMAILTRTQALAILIAEGIYLVILFLQDILRKKRLRAKEILLSVPFRVSVLTALLYLLLTQTIFRTPDSTLAYYGNLLTDHKGSWAQALGENFAYLHELLLDAFRYYANNGFVTTLGRIGVYMILTFAMLGFFITLRDRFEVSHVYVLVVCLLLIVLSQRQGVRFAFYLMPFMLLYAHAAMRAFLPGIFRMKPTLLAVLLTIAYLGLGKGNFKHLATRQPTEDNIPVHRDSLVFDYLKTHVADEDVIIYAKPRALTLFTNKRAVVASPSLSYEENSAYFSKIPGKKYLLMNDVLGYEMNAFYAEAPKHATAAVELGGGYHFYVLP